MKKRIRIGFICIASIVMISSAVPLYGQETMEKVSGSIVNKNAIVSNENNIPPMQSSMDFQDTDRKNTTSHSNIFSLPPNTAYIGTGGIANRNFVLSPQAPPYAKQIMQDSEGQQWFINELERQLNSQQKTLNFATDRTYLRDIYSLGMTGRILSI